jgi:hypothetical protein
VALIPLMRDKSAGEEAESARPFSNVPNPSVPDALAPDVASWSEIGGLVGIGIAGG